MNISDLITKITQLLKYDVGDLAVFLSPILYSFAWLILLILAISFLPLSVVGSEWFVILYSIVFLFALISKSTVWSIGHEKFGLKGDSRAKVINYHDGDFWFDLFADNVDLLTKETIQEFVKSLITKGEREEGSE